ncbi:NAD(P)-dependent oxidoreductase [Liquorilactobacillus uvarum]|uniref:Glyoxylate reductase n=1 Tax=Liquorilactobacillus uvarum DSM 19971 TaxID=1423812 RepID=A0A0R1PTV8_9LACO|nr:NAD(P)-dependent oxidoreductase [Liquorilactobacillus uvarum]KRL33141.1 glyoxylate reductase [Liquorilactobacillus uvarum DSM 19971]
MIKDQEPFFWIIDEEWSDYETEQNLIRKQYPKATIKISGYDYGKDLEKWGKQADIILAQVYTEIPAEIIKKLTNCRGIALFGGGYDRIDIEQAATKHIPVTNVKNYCKEDIAEYVISAILYSNKPIDSFSKVIGKKMWGLQAMPKLKNRINEQSLLVIGFGRIGKFVAQKALSLGMKVYAYDPKLQVGAGINNVEFVDLAEGLKNADFITIHCNLSKATEKLIGKKEFASMKQNCVLINTARGGIINEPDLLEAVEEKKISGAVLDVITEEPPTNEKNEILNTKNIIVTPHVSYLSIESINELKKRAVENGIALYEGRLTDDVVNG